MAAAQFDVERLRLQSATDEATDLADALRERARELDDALAQRVRDFEEMEITCAALRDQLAGAQSEIKALLTQQRQRDDEYRTALANKIESHQREREADRAEHQAIVGDKNRQLERLEGDLARVDEQYRELQREKAQAVEAQRKAEAESKRLGVKLAEEAQRSGELKAELNRVSLECDQAKAEVALLERRLRQEIERGETKAGRATPRFLKRVRGQL